MNSRRKVYLIILALFSAFFIFMVFNIWNNFRNFGLKHAEEKAKLTAEIVKAGLTAHMVNGMIDQRGFFMDQINNLENITSLWVSRAPSVIEQFGEGHNNEIPRDNIDKQVLQTGEYKEVITETATKSYLRVTIPFVATAFGNPNCLACHKAQEGEVLGAVSMTIDISDMRGSSFITIIYNAIAAIIAMSLVLMVINFFIKPYVNIFYSIRDVMQRAYEGDYSKRVYGGGLQETKGVADMLNSLLEKLQRVLEEIDKKVYVFIQNKNKEKHADPLVNINSTIDQLSDIYKFKQTIENDEDLSDVYERIAHVFRNKFMIEDFVFIEANTVTKDKKIVYSQNSCHCRVTEGVCRADRINSVVDSKIFDKLCDKFNDEAGLDYICVPYPISHELNLIVSIVTRSEEESQRIRKNIYLIEDYISTARPAIVSRKLMQILKEVARVDQLTGMYNRKYLDEFADKMIPQALRTNTAYGILMVDIDFFKMINDTYGHDIGDEAIRTISRVIKENIRKSDIAVRFGGEEFIVLLHNCTKEKINEVAQKIRVSFSEQKIQAETKTFSKTLSVGTSSFPEDSESIWKCIKFADIALYSAKETGRNKVVSFDKRMLKEGSMEDSY